MNYWNSLLPQALQLPCNSMHLLIYLANLPNKVTRLVSKGREGISVLVPTQLHNSEIEAQAWSLTSITTGKELKE